MIKAVIFDFRDTLLKVDQAYKAANKQLFSAIKKRYPKLATKRPIGRFVV